MLMTKDEITAMYRDAKNKMKQVGILADMNCCTKKEMREYLRIECGYEIYEPKGKQKSNQELVTTISVDLSDLIKDIKARAFGVVSSSYDLQPREWTEGFLQGVQVALDMIKNY